MTRETNYGRIQSNVTLTSTYNVKGNSERDKIQRQLTFSYAKMRTCNKAPAINLHSNKLRAPYHVCEWQCNSPIETKVHIESSSLFNNGHFCYHNDMGQILCAFVFGKARVTLLKSITMPRLELDDAVVSVRVREQLRKELSFGIIEETFWRDSQVVPSYLANESRKFHIREKTSVNPIQQTKRRVVLMQETSRSQNGSGGPHILYGRRSGPNIESLKSFHCQVTTQRLRGHPHVLQVQRKWIIITYSWYKAKRAIAICLRYLSRLANKGEA